ncbi:MAG: PHP domain-containing protein [Deltaproteobacteria bacterium]|nr:PHP domain-containing protein [Deltaproteobacteria bacterium]
MRRIRLAFVMVAACAAACGDDEPGLADYFPELPDPTGGSQEVFAGQVTDPSQLVAGPAQSGMVGDFFIKNDRATFIVQAPTRVIGVIPQGGNVVDVVLTSNGQQIVDDHFGELGLIYLLGRTCEAERIEIVRDGSEGGIAAIRAVGKSGNDDFLNIKGIGVLPVDQTVDPDIPDGVLCATTYVLAPGSTTLEVHHSLFNKGPDEVHGPMGTIADTGGDTEAWTNARGFQRADISAIATLGQPQPSDFVLYQGPGVAYGVIPRHDVPTVHTQALIAGVSILLNGNQSLLEILQPDKYFLHLKPHVGLRQRYDLVVGVDGADIDEVFRNTETLRAVTGRVDFSGGGAAARARVGVFVDGNGNGQIDAPDFDGDGDGQPDDRIISYLDVGADGTFSGNVATTAGNLLLRAEVKNVGRSQVVPVADSVNLTIPSPIKVDFQILDDETNAPMPGRLLVIGDHPAFPDQRVFETSDRLDGVVASLHAIRGTTTDVGDGADPAIFLPAGGTYRIYVSRGTEWSIDSLPVGGNADVNLTFNLRHVNPTPGYLGSDWHVHQVGSPDSPVLSDERIRSAVSAGVEMFAVTDHDYISDLQPLVESLGLEQVLRVVPGLEVTPFAYGHFNGWPFEPDVTSASRGAIDWAAGPAPGVAKIPGEVYQALRERGAQMVQVNHPRGSGFTEFQAAFQRANVKYDFTRRIIFGDYENASVPNDFLRLPGQSLWSDQFNGLEVWNGFAIADSNGDGLRENKSLDRVMRDWVSMLSLGMFVTPAGNSDTHTSIADPLGMPRTYIRVPDDSAAALANGSAVAAVLATQTGANNTPRDVVVTNGPMIDVKVGGQPALGRVFAAAGGAITVTVTVTSPDWAEFDTLEVFANTTPDPVDKTDNTILVPLKCFTSRSIAAISATDPCKLAPLAPQAMNVQLANVPGPGNARRFVATVTLTLDAQDIATRAGATGTDAWLVFRARGDRAIFPLLTNGAIDTASKAALLSGDFDAIRTALTGKGVPAAAFTTPVFVDFDGGGYRAPFAP